ncbi:MAG: flotillin family protein, partial [Clostridia bacterium]|nr:flotillin family protein [Clostridia bacterium]
MNSILASDGGLVALVVIIPLILVMVLLLLATRFKKCPSDKIMVVYGKVSSGKGEQHRSAKCLHGGVSFIV